jgi:hypothetical protein
MSWFIKPRKDVDEIAQFEAERQERRELFEQLALAKDESLNLEDRLSALTECVDILIKRAVVIKPLQ